MTAECQSRRSCVGFDGAAALAAEVRLDGGPLCDGCLSRAAADITELRHDHSALTAELSRPVSGPRTGFVSGGDTDAPVPLALDVDAMQRRIVWTLTVWEPPVREALGLPAPVGVGVRDPWIVANACRLLARRVRTLAGLGPVWGYADGLDAGPVERDGVYAVDSLRQVHAAAQRMLGVQPVTRSLPGACLRCGGHGALLHEDGSDLVRCAGCGTAQSFDAYRDGYGRPSLIN